MRMIIWAFRLLIFLLLLTLALRNMQPATISLMDGLAWEMPTIFLVLVSFLVGIVLSLLSVSAFILRQRREVLRLSAELHAAQTAHAHSDAGMSLLPPSSP